MPKTPASKSKIPVKPAAATKPKTQTNPSRKTDVGKATAPNKDVGK